MDKYKLLKKITQSPNNTSFDDFVNCIKKFGFVFVRQTGSHKMFKCSSIQELINIQDNKGKAKPEQIKYFEDIVIKYNL